MKNCCGGELLLTALVTVMVKAPFAVNTLVATGVH